MSYRMHCDICGKETDDNHVVRLAIRTEFYQSKHLRNKEDGEQIFAGDVCEEHSMANVIVGICREKWPGEFPND